jgi:acetate kinase
MLLTINSGSSSVKFALFDDRVDRVLDGNITDLSSQLVTVEVLNSRGDLNRLRVPLSDAGELADWIVSYLESTLGRTVTCVVHRIVNGGEAFDRARTIDQALLEELERLIPLAPNHLPAELALIRAFTGKLPRAAAVACFDTSFHRDLPAIARTLPVPDVHSPVAVRRYGFHGLSYAYLVSELARLAGPRVANGRLILAHLGSGASVAAVRDGPCVDTTMGFTPAGGLVMATRSGDIDPGVVVYLARSAGLTIDEIDDVMTHRAGLLAVSGISGDMKTLQDRETTDSRAKLAVDLFCYRVRLAIGAFAAALDGVETVVFAGGIGEHAPDIRRRICDGLHFLGVDLDPSANARGASIISSPSSRVSIRVIPTDEALTMAREARALLAAQATEN